MGTEIIGRNGSCIFQSFMNYPLHSCRKYDLFPIFVYYWNKPLANSFVGKKRIWKWLFFFKKKLLFFFPFFLQLEWNMGLRSLFFIISPKHYIWWQLVSWIPQPQLSFWVQTSVQHHPLHSRSRIWQKHCKLSIVTPALLSHPPDQGHCCPSTNRPEPGPHPPFLSLEIHSLSWVTFCLRLSVAPIT